MKTLPRRSAVVAICLALLTVAMTLAACTSKPTPPDLGKRDAMVAQVMKALNADDAKGLTGLAGQGASDTDASAQKMVADWGEVNNNKYTVDYTSEFTPNVAVVSVGTTDKTGQPISIRFSISWHDPSWLLDIGNAVNTTGASHPASP